MLSAGAASRCCTASAARPRLSVDISCRLGAQQQTRRPPLLMSINGTERRTDRRTDGRTPDRYLDRAAHTMLAASISIKHRKNNIGFFSIIFVIIWFNITAAMVGVSVWVIAYSVYYKNVTAQHSNSYIQQQQQNPFNGPFLGLPGWAGTRKVKPIWILLKQETVSGSGISRAICKSAPCSRQITMPASHHSVFYRPDALPAAQPTAPTHWRQIVNSCLLYTSPSPRD